ncbi:hypothetical protein CC78DRAFT_620909 [Lojkania enalia]|uniref:Uncharacterized protein n=1 Tax=Lojkania enalia TaxID=147567 RepID=A0A9P4K3S8_9PLEO|nr:hypothetical protein CC78DRAFT_620909 [Didymosphaeria enalia]
MSSFSKANQLVRDFEPKAGAPPIATLTVHPSIVVNNVTEMKQFLDKEFHSQDFEAMNPRLWLIQHQSDFNIAQQDNLRLVPNDVDWASFYRFVPELNHVENSAMSRRYYYDELKLTRLHFYAPLFLRKFDSE